MGDDKCELDAVLGESEIAVVEQTAEGEGRTSQMEEVEDSGGVDSDVNRELLARESRESDEASTNVEDRSTLGEPYVVVVVVFVVVEVGRVVVV